jgi:RNA polymerase-binding transcription factor DksA
LIRIKAPRRRGLLGVPREFYRSLTMIVADTRKDQLEARLRELDSRLHSIEQELDAPVSPDSEERATERESEEVLEDLGMAGQQEIRMIRAALDRIRDGSYGTCVRCEETISEQRLDVLPHTPLCRDCAAKA